MKIGPDFHVDAKLRDGTPVVVRHIRPDDADDVRRGFAELSPESRYRRFLGGISHLSDAMVRYLTQVDGVDHVAIVAGVITPDQKTERGIGVARFIRVEGHPHVAEAAVTVVDAWQGRGVGTLLLGYLAEAARERDVHFFRAEMLASNEPMRTLAEHMGAVIERADGETLVIDVALDPLPHEDESPLRRMFRSAASSVMVFLARILPLGHRD